MPLIVRAFIILASAAITATAANAQDRPVEQGVGDVDPLLKSLRVVHPDLRMDVGFEHLFQVDPADPHSSFYRRAGGIYAVFPRSVYTMTREGLIIETPPGTVFHFGKPRQEAQQHTPSPISAERARAGAISSQREVVRFDPAPTTQQRLDRSASSPSLNDASTTLIEAALSDTVATSSRPAVMSDEHYRARRLAQIAARHGAT